MIPYTTSTPAAYVGPCVASANNDAIAHAVAGPTVGTISANPANSASGIAYFRLIALNPIIDAVNTIVIPVIVPITHRRNRGPRSASAALMLGRCFGDNNLNPGSINRSGGSLSRKIDPTNPNASEIKIPSTKSAPREKSCCPPVPARKSPNAPNSPSTFTGSYSPRLLLHTSSVLFTFSFVCGQSPIASEIGFCNGHDNANTTAATTATSPNPSTATSNPRGPGM